MSSRRCLWELSSSSEGINHDPDHRVLRSFTHTKQKKSYEPETTRAGANTCRWGYARLRLSADTPNDPAGNRVRGDLSAVETIGATVPFKERIGWDGIGMERTGEDGKGLDGSLFS